MVATIRGNKLLLRFGSGNGNLKSETTQAKLSWEDSDGGLLTFEEESLPGGL
jgi:hypothetical protein